MSGNNKWTLGNLHRSKGEFEYTGEYDSPIEACAQKNMDCWVYDTKRGEHIRYDPIAHHNVTCVECSHTSGGAYNTYYKAFRKPESPKLELTSQTVFALPANRDRTTISVGESVVINANIPVKWQLQGVGNIDAYSQTSLRFTAFDNAGSVTITATAVYENKQYTKNLTFTVIEPDGIQYEQGFHIANPDKPLLYHPAGGISAVVGLWLRVLPLSVNFGNLELKEEDSAGMDTGLLGEGGPVRCHINQAPVAGLCPADTAQPYIPVVNRGDKHNFLGANAWDTVGFYAPVAYHQVAKNLHPTNVNSFDITVRWRLRGAASYKIFPQKVSQVFILYKNGNISVSKGNFQRSFNLNDSFEDGSFITKKLP